MHSVSKHRPLKVHSKGTQVNQVKLKDSHSQAPFLLLLTSSLLTTLPIHSSVMPAPSTTTTGNNIFSKVPKVNRIAPLPNVHTVDMVVLNQTVHLLNSPKAQPNSHNPVLQPQAKVKPVATQLQIQLLKANPEELAKQAHLNLATLNNLKQLTIHMATHTTLALITLNT